ncbi:MULTISPECIES: type IV toxin-antitoxin system AbiEi family antitoxin domain-containing protein [unclassified Curtobacterium]|uniref:type IV toxin-antitoxin system AbiEi family antitoxin domain-containing protein n=1 Tax=unclassified Curtobacterium TaxID=257496 RepID=UPI000F49AF3C|nr:MULTISPECIES: type IV toxin-antitoxin system AbiEi family antitoxin domain-containing protein [unclassified Curtobacterium]
MHDPQDSVPPPRRVTPRLRLRSPSLSLGGRSPGEERRQAAARVRPRVVSLAATQGGLVTLEQVARIYGRGAAKLGLRRLTDLGELLRVRSNVWVHTAVDRLPIGDQTLEAEACWLALEPNLTLSQRTVRDRGSEDVIAVIGGGAALARWELDELSWRAELLVPVAVDGVFSDGDVKVIPCEVDRADVRWVGGYPYLCPEATLAWAYDATGDLDNVAVALRDAMWRLYPLRSELLTYHLRVVAEKNGWMDDRWNADLIYERLLLIAGDWPTPSRGRYGDGWWSNADHVRRVRERHPDWVDINVLREWDDEYRSEKDD